MLSVAFTPSSAQRISKAVQRVEATPYASKAGDSLPLGDHDRASVGLRNDLGRQIGLGECFVLGAAIAEDVYFAALPDRHTDYVVVSAGVVNAGKTGRGWTSGVRVVQYKERADGYGATINAPMTLAPVSGQTYLSYSPFGEFEVIRIISAPSGVTPGLAWVRLLQPNLGSWNTIAVAGENPKLLTTINIDTITSMAGVRLKLTDDGRGWWTLGLQAV